MLVYNTWFFILDMVASLWEGKLNSNQLRRDGLSQAIPGWADPSETYYKSGSPMTKWGYGTSEIHTTDYQDLYLLNFAYFKAKYQTEVRRLCSASLSFCWPRKSIFGFYFDLHKCFTFVQSSTMSNWRDPVGWGCKIHQLHLCKGVKLP